MLANGLLQHVGAHQHGRSGGATALEGRSKLPSLGCPFWFISDILHVWMCELLIPINLQTIAVVVVVVTPIFGRTIDLDDQVRQAGTSNTNDTPKKARERRPVDLYR